MYECSYVHIAFRAYSMCYKIWRGERQKRATPQRCPLEKAIKVFVTFLKEEQKVFFDTKDLALFSALPSLYLALIFLIGGKQVERLKKRICRHILGE